MIAAEARMFTLDQAGAEMGFTHKHRARTVARLVKKGLVITELGYRTKRVAHLDLLKFQNELRAVEKATKRRK